MTAEQWREVPGWEGFYAVSDMGRVKSLSRSVPGRPGVFINRRERVLTGSLSDGYPTVALCRGNRKTEVKVHCLVLLAFVGPRPTGMDACHYDGDRANPRLENLRWDTKSANTLDKVRHGRHPMAARTHCARGHAFDEANTYRPPGAANKRMCRACTVINKRAMRARSAAA